MPNDPSAQTSSRVVQPDAGQSFWQPVPANGHVEVKVVGGAANGMAEFDCGLQEVAPGCYVREHAHDRNEELIFVHEGEGEAVVDGETHPMRPGTTFYLAKDSRHLFRNTGDTPMTPKIMMTMTLANQIHQGSVKMRKSAKPKNVRSQEK